MTQFAAPAMRALKKAAKATKFLAGIQKGLWISGAAEIAGAAVALFFISLPFVGASLLSGSLPNDQP